MRLNFQPLLCGTKESYLRLAQKNSKIIKDKWQKGHYL